MKKIEKNDIENKLKTPIAEYQKERDIIAFYNKIIDIDEELIPISLFLLVIEEFNNIIDMKTENLEQIPDTIGNLLNENKETLDNLVTFLKFDNPLLDKEE